MSELIIKNMWTQSHNSSIYRNETGKTIISFHNAESIGILSFARDTLKKKITSAVKKTCKINLIPVEEVVGNCFVCELTQLKKEAEKILDCSNIELLIGSTNEYPGDIHLYARKKGEDIEWLTNRSES